MTDKITMHTRREMQSVSGFSKSKGRIEEIIRHIVEKIRNHYHPEKIILFGSYAYGKPTEDSDIDIVVIKREAGNTSSIDRSVEVRKILAEENRLLPITPVVYTPEELEERISMGDDFVAEVLERGRVLYAR